MNVERQHKCNTTDTLSLNIHFSLYKDDGMYYSIICNNKICIENNNKLSEEFVNHIKYYETHKKLLSQMVNNDIKLYEGWKTFQHIRSGTRTH